MPPNRDSPLAALYARIAALTDKLGDPLLAAFEVTERLTQSQAQQMYDLALVAGAPCRDGALAFTVQEADVIQLLSVRLRRPVVWQHIVIGPDRVFVAPGRYVEEKDKEKQNA